MVQIHHTQTATSALNPAATKVNIFTKTLDVNQFKKVRVIAVVSVEQNASSGANTQAFNIVYNTSTILAYPIKTFAALKFDIITLVAEFEARESADVEVDIAAGTADANTAIIGKYFSIESVS